MEIWTGHGHELGVPGALESRVTEMENGVTRSVPCQGVTVGVGG